MAWEDIVPLFYSKFYPPSEIHKDRNKVYNFWPHDGESIAQAWGRLKLLMLGAVQRLYNDEVECMESLEENPLLGSLLSEII
jgi:hypothetical protein